jgi:hypothetical protein
MSEWSDSVPLLMALLFSAHALVEYGANLVSNFDLEFSQFWGNKAFIAALGYLTPLWASPVRKRIWALKVKCVMLLLSRRLVYSSRDLHLQVWFKRKNDEDFLHSKNAPTLCPMDLICDMDLASSFI